MLAEVTKRVDMQLDKDVDLEFPSMFGACEHFFGKNNSIIGIEDSNE